MRLGTRAAFRDHFDYGGTLAELDPANVSNIQKAVENAQAFAGEVLLRLRGAREGQGRGSARS